MPSAPMPSRAAAKTSRLLVGPLLRAVQQPAVRRDQVQGADLGGDGGRVPAGAVGSGAGGAGDRLLHDVAHVGEREALRARARLRSFSTVPAATVTVPASRSIACIPESAWGRTSTPSVAAAAVKEWPVPTAFTRSPSSAARRTTSWSSPTEVGVTTRAGAAVTLPAQLRHAAGVPRPDFPAVAVPIASWLLPLRRPRQPAVSRERHRGRGAPRREGDDVPVLRAGGVYDPAGHGGTDRDADREAVLIQVMPSVSFA